MLNKFVPALLILPLLAFGQDKPELTLDQIVQKHIDALGGIDKLKAITTLSATGKATMQGGQMEAPMLMQMKRPSSMRMEITIQGKKIVQAFDGTTAWMINPMMGSDAPQKASDDDTQEMKDSADIDFSSLVNYKEKGNTVELVGTEDVEGNPTYKLKVTKKNGRVEYQYLDAKTFLPIKTTTKRKQMGTELEIDAYPSNFKPVNGVLFPYTVDQKLGGKSMIQLTLDKVDVNKPIDDATFQFPEKPKAEPKSEPKAEPKP
jgi:outer membrane lipoprotein-sorting protein